MSNHLQEFYKGKKIFVTGHTGFKGSWLCMLLSRLGANILGYALEPKQDVDDLFTLAKIDKIVDSKIDDIRNFDSLKSAIIEAKPDIIFHLAAQSLVRESYKNPLYNYQTNILGSVNVLEAAMSSGSVKAVINVTTDKCYHNHNSLTPFKESDRLGGFDPYSASKACSELITESYNKSFYRDLEIGLASARAGNVIGGGDFSKNRILPDLVRSIISDDEVVLRNPSAVRPWQFVLDVLHGYLLLAYHLYNDSQNFSESFNFGPHDANEVSVEQIVKKFFKACGQEGYKIITRKDSLHEQPFLRLDSTKSNKMLNWQPIFTIDESIKLTGEWYLEFLSNKANSFEFSMMQIKSFMNKINN